MRRFSSVAVTVACVMIAVAMGGAGIYLLSSPSVGRWDSRSVRSTGPQAAASLLHPSRSDAADSEVPRQDGRQPALTPRDESRGSGESLEQQEARVAREARSHRWGTRIQVDRVRRSLTVSREIAYGGGCVQTESGDACFVLDSEEVEQRDPFDRGYEIDGVHVRVMLMRYGPFDLSGAEGEGAEAAVEGVDSEGPEREVPAIGATRIYLWVDGRCRVEGLLDGSIWSPTGAEAFRRIVVHGGPSLVWSSTVRGTGEVLETTERGADYLSARPWVMTPSWCFGQAELEERIDRDRDGEAGRVSDEGSASASEA